MSAPTQQQIRDAIKTKMLTVANVGVINTFERYAASLAAMKPFYVSAGKILGWNIRLPRTQRLSPHIGRVMVVHTWRITGYMSLDDSAQSELVLDTLVEALQHAFDADETLGGVIATTNAQEGGPSGLQRDNAGPVMFCGVLCHSVSLTLFTLHAE